MKNSQIRQFKYFKMLVQEFHIKVDLGFVNALVELFAQSNQSDEEEVSLIVFKYFSHDKRSKLLLCSILIYVLFFLN